MERFLCIAVLCAPLVGCATNGRPAVSVEPTEFADEFIAAFDNAYPDRTEWTRLWAYGTGIETSTRRSFAWVAWSDRNGFITFQCDIVLTDGTVRRISNEEGEWYSWKIRPLPARTPWLSLERETTMIRTENRWITDVYTKIGCDYLTVLGRVIAKMNATGAAQLTFTAGLEALHQNTP